MSGREGREFSNLVILASRIEELKWNMRIRSIVSISLETTIRGAQRREAKRTSFPPVILKT